MRNLNKGKQLSLKKGPRTALLKTLVNSFFLHEKIKTTETKAKAIKPIIEKMITRAKNPSVANRRILSKYATKIITKKIVDQIAPIYKEKSGGYTRIIKLGQRSSDGAKIAIIELVK